jgi:hypothetical protein
MARHYFDHRCHEKQIGTVDESVCRKANPAAFRKLNGLVAMHCTLTNDSLQALGPEKTAQILPEIRERLQPKFKLGGAPS